MNRSRFSHKLDTEIALAYETDCKKEAQRKLKSRREEQRRISSRIAEVSRRLIDCFGLDTYRGLLELGMYYPKSNYSNIAEIPFLTYTIQIQYTTSGRYDVHCDEREASATYIHSEELKDVVLVLLGKLKAKKGGKA